MPVRVQHHCLASYLRVKQIAISASYCDKIDELD